MATRSLEQRVTVLEETVVSLQTLSHELAEFRRKTNARFDQIDARFEQIDARFDRLEQRMSMDKEELYTHMRVLHEELLERIKTIRGGRDGGPPPRRGRKK